MKTKFRYNHGSFEESLKTTEVFDNVESLISHLSNQDHILTIEYYCFDD